MMKVGAVQARNALWHVHNFGRSKRWRGKAGVLAMFSRHPVVQSDPIDIAGRSHDLMIHSRVDGYNPLHLDSLLYEDRALFEYYCKMASIIPMETYPVFGHFRKKQALANKPRLCKYRKEAEEILEAMARAPVCSRDFEGEKTDHWWGRAKIHRIVLEDLFTEGRIVIHHRKSGVKYYTSPEKTVPKRLLEVEPPGQEGYLKAKAALIARSSRLVSPNGGAYAGFGESPSAPGAKRALSALVEDGTIMEVSIEGWRGSCYIPKDDEDVWRDPPEPSNEMRFLAPLDPLIWNRRLFSHIYGNGYTWEVYKRPSERVYGYYCLPMLWKGQYAGLIEPFLRKKDCVLEVRSMNLFKDFDSRQLRGPLNEAMAVLAKYTGTETVAWDEGARN